MQSVLNIQENNANLLACRIDSYFGMMQHSIQILGRQHLIKIRYAGYLKESEVLQAISDMAGPGWRIDAHCAFTDRQLNFHSMMLLHQMREELNEILHPEKAVSS